MKSETLKVRRLCETFIPMGAGELEMLMAETERQSGRRMVRRNVRKEGGRLRWVLETYEVVA